MLRSRSLVRHNGESPHAPEPEPVRYNRRTRQVTDQDGHPLELHGDFGGDPARPPPGLDGLHIMRPSELEARYRALLAEPVGEHRDPTTGLVVGQSKHLEIAADPAVPSVLRVEAIEQLNDAAGEDRYLLSDTGALRDLVEERREAAALLEDRAAAERLGLVVEASTGSRRLTAQEAEYEDVEDTEDENGGAQDEPVFDTDPPSDAVQAAPDTRWWHKVAALLGPILVRLPLSWQVRLMQRFFA